MRTAPSNGDGLPQRPELETNVNKHLGALLPQLVCACMVLGTTASHAIDIDQRARVTSAEASAVGMLAAQDGACMGLGPKDSRARGNDAGDSATCAEGIPLGILSVEHAEVGAVRKSGVIARVDVD